jgi:hypothetical protein
MADRIELEPPTGDRRQWVLFEEATSLSWDVPKRALAELLVKMQAHHINPYIRGGL